MSNYCIVKDDHLGWYKLYRTDSDTVPPGEVLWQGDSLKVGYDKMKSINNTHRKIIIYSVASSISETGRKIFRIYKETPQAPWTVVKTHMKYDAAKEHLKELKAARDAEEEATFERKMSILGRVHYTGKRLPKLTATDWKYLDYLRQSDRLTEEEKATIDWFKETEQSAVITA